MEPPQQPSNTRAGQTAGGRGSPTAPEMEAPSIVEAIRAGALCKLDSALSQGLLDTAPLLDRLALALFQFDFVSARACLDALKDDEADLRQAVQAALLLDDEQPAGSAPPPADVSAPPSDGARDLVLTLAGYLEQGLGDVLGRRIPEGLDEPSHDPLHRYVFCRLLIHIHPDVASAPREVFLGGGGTVSEAQAYCAAIHALHEGRVEITENAISNGFKRYRGSGHLFYLKHLLALSRNRVDEAKAWLLNAWTCPGIDERLTERVHALFALDVDCPDVDHGLRAMKHVGHSGSFAVRRGNIGLSARPDSPHARSACLAFSNEDLVVDCEQALETFRQMPVTWQPGPECGAPETNWGGSDKVFLCVVPGKSALDIGLVLSAQSMRVPFWTDLLGRLVLDARRGDRPTLSDLVLQAASLRVQWDAMEKDYARRQSLGPAIILQTDPRDLPALRILWPNARFVLCVPDDAVAHALADINRDLAGFDTTLVWRRTRDVVRLLSLCGVQRARRASLVRNADHWRATFYPL
jgi:hypothetical protein